MIRNIQAKVAVLGLAVAASSLFGIQSASAATPAPSAGVSSAGLVVPAAIGAPEWAYYGGSESACKSAQTRYKNVYDAHILIPCEDTTGWFNEAYAGAPPEWGFEYQLQ